MHHQLKPIRMKTASRNQPDQTGLECSRQSIAAIRGKTTDMPAYTSRCAVKRTAHTIMKKSYTTHQIKKL